MPNRPPSVDALARSLADVGLPHPLLVDAARDAIAAGEPSSARARAQAVATAMLRPVINATGVLLHTNLGRAPLPLRPSNPATEAGGAADPAGNGRTSGTTCDAGAGGTTCAGAGGTTSGAGAGGTTSGAGAGGPLRYSNLEFDLETGRRGSRHRHAASLLARAAGAEAALVVNNGAAAVVLMLSTLAAGCGVVISRGELVEIGGGFRVPEVMATSGAHLVEVGTTNRTRVADYQAAVTDATALILKVHQSNYKLVGFTESAPVAELAAIGPPVVADIGSGLLDATTPWLHGGPPAWLRDEPAARQTLAEGAALVTFSGDKLLGGPQAGIIAGRKELVERCARHPLMRAFRPGGLVLAALQATALGYLRRDLAALPFWSLATVPPEALHARAQTVAGRLGRSDVTVAACVSVPGGGSLPGLEIPSAGLVVRGDHTEALRRADPPIIARTRDGVTVCDLRAVDPHDDACIGRALAALPQPQAT